MALASPSLVELAQRNAPKRLLRTLLCAAITNAQAAIRAYDHGDRHQARDEAAVAAVYLSEALGRFADQEGKLNGT